jgi:hypothetical protein
VIERRGLYRLGKTRICPHLFRFFFREALSERSESNPLTDSEFISEEARRVEREPKDSGPAICRSWASRRDFTFWRAIARLLAVCHAQRSRALFLPISAWAGFSGLSSSLRNLIFLPCRLLRKIEQCFQNGAQQIVEFVFYDGLKRSNKERQ